jgi:hypothetical protein
MLRRRRVDKHRAQCAERQAGTMPHEHDLAASRHFDDLSRSSEQGLDRPPSKVSTGVQSVDDRVRHGIAIGRHNIGYVVAVVVQAGSQGVDLRSVDGDRNPGHGGVSAVDIVDRVDHARAPVTMRPTAEPQCCASIDEPNVSLMFNVQSRHRAHRRGLCPLCTPCARTGNYLGVLFEAPCYIRQVLFRCG